MNPILSIVTVTFRDLDGLGTTLASLEGLRSLAGDEIQLVVVDGGTPRIHEAIRNVDDGMILVSEPDQGIYDAMNKGVNLSKGGYVWFLNGGDESLVADWPLLREELVDGDSALLLFDYEMQAGRSLSIQRRSRPIRYLRHGLPTSHQAILYPRSALGASPYDLEFKVAGDYHLTARLVAEGLASRTIPTSLARFAPAGWSGKNAKQLRREARRVQHDVLRANPWSIGLSQAHHRASHLAATAMARLPLGGARS